MSFFKENKAQGALEYLLMIGGAILIAAIVIGVIVSTAKKSGGKADSITNDAMTGLNQAVNNTTNSILDKTIPTS